MKSVFPQKQIAPLFAIRSCIADRANTVNRTEFEQLKVVVNTATEKCKQLIETTNEVIETSNLFSVIFDKMYTYIYPTGTVYFSSMTPENFMKYQQGFGVWGYFSGNWGYTAEPIDTIEFTWFDPITVPKKEENETGSGSGTAGDGQGTGSGSGTAGDGQDAGAGDGQGTGSGSGSETVEQEVPPTWDELQNRDPANADEETVVGQNKKHIMKIPIYAYWCQAEESVADVEMPEDKPTIPTMGEDGSTGSGTTGSGTTGTGAENDYLLSLENRIKALETKIATLESGQGETTT